MRPPSVDALARSLADLGLPHPLLVDAARAAIAAGDPDSARRRAVETTTRLLGPVVNATGVLLHTNLGRAPLEPSWTASGGPSRASNLELDLTTGRRGSRQAHAASLLARLIGAEQALVVNNGAAAVLLVLSALAPGRDVVVSRGELVEIGGGFRIPEVLAASGARLVEVGTTNRTRLADYQAAVEGGDVALVLKVHQSNYRVVGFTESVSVPELGRLGVPVVVDLGSGLLDTATPWLRRGPPSWLEGEPAARQTLEAGAALVTFSGDKLLGGPQAGIIAGRADLVRQLARHPLNRALRPGGLVLSTLQATALAYLRRDGDAVPLWRMATVPVDELWRRASALGVGEPVTCVAVAGGGSVPGQEIPSAGVALPGDLTSALRCFDPPVIARVEGGRTILDLRTVDPADDQVLAAALAVCLGDGAGP
ncbi:MAG: L-seryl-tRNA(Sec) selenium transferase [Acidimicrobiales bacterium]|nr:L-seryl-tRNA(Sec) selenium transferase [Acidimicrobiales bacterium]MBO0885957.1 L-seryl-tRNA(Sec) selenium transferase [Acidimicrobiales bacterium]